MNMNGLIRIDLLAQHDNVRRKQDNMRRKHENMGRNVRIWEKRESMNRNMRI